MRVLLVSKLVVFAFLAGGLLAQTIDQPKPAENQCENATTTAAMRTCEMARFQTAQRELEAAYEGLMKHLETEQQQKLRLAQRAWLRFRDANADFQASTAQGGTLAPLIRVGTLTEMTKARTADLKRQAEPR